MRESMRRIVLAGAVLVLAIGATPVRAGPVTWPLYDDPDSGPSFTNSVGGPNNNDFFLAITVHNEGAAHPIGIVEPLFNIRDTRGTLAWDQGRDGWYGADVDGTSLLVTVTSPSTRLLYSNVADGTGMAQAVNSLPPPFSQTTDPSASYPFLDLGVIPPGATGPVTFDFHFGWGDGRAGVLTGDIQGFAQTVTANPAFVPEPASLALGGTSVLAGLGYWWFRRCRRTVA